MTQLQSSPAAQAGLDCSIHMRKTIVAVLAAVLATVSSASPAQAALTEVNVRIEGASKTLFEGPILTEGHDVSSYKEDGGGAADLAEHSCDGIDPLDPENTVPGATPTAASVDAMDLIGETDALAGQWYPSFEDYFVKQWGKEAENAEAGSRSWGVLVNNVFTSVGGCQYELAAGDEVLWIYNAFESRPILGLFAANEHYSSGTRPLTAVAQLNQPFEVEVAAYDDQKEGQPPATPQRNSKDTVPYEAAKVAPVATSAAGFETVQLESPEAVVTNSEGKASIIFTTPGWHRIMAGASLDHKGEEAVIRSNRLDVCVPAAGETGCGALPAEDVVRTPPRYLKKSTSSEEHHEEAGPSGPGPAGSPGQTSGKSTAHLVGVSVSKTRVVLRLTAAGRATVSIARWVRTGRKRRWRAFKQIAVSSKGAGKIEVKLPRLPPGRYRVSVRVPGAGAVVKTLTVPERR